MELQSLADPEEAHLAPPPQKDDNLAFYTPNAKIPLSLFH